MAHNSHILSLFLLSVVLFASTSSSLSILLQNPEPYCFSVIVKKSNDIRVTYAISGLNEEQVEFKVKYENGEEIYTMSNKRENDIVVKATKDAKVNLCWQKQDRKTKKLTFNFQVSDMNSQAIAGQDTVELLNQELAQIQERLDIISRNVYLQQDMDKQHFDQTVSSASTQTWMSILKMFLVIGVCMGQVYFITQFFQAKGGKKDMNPFGRNVI